ncbi:MAG: hypothetical protein APG12_01230 [Candidatus Methanofastidiosum methylothiophilum]|uniref:Uncharacterized protein n=1 Tax=Candidatus Methanofastidiosum methylothiophilum TaxID=1705564 RepID=A0A150IIX7_9EURY|nr:MAG: hypothetical protein APG10_01297 [Candidatus Methanofastidiosum methylthiophilus]KYC47801.1 MAG: hypothetical protein APG11_00879 [Candidatus Methanofastidiosum methylthiophilus]KYC49831.1 MAG: hypothetical protein APG12_01230 [Candidatus Methanofastidiosum methylthiophilus]
MPLHSIKLLDEEKDILFPVWTVTFTAIITSLGYLFTKISIVSKIAFLFKVEFTYLSIPYMEVFPLKENNYLRNAAGDFYAI